MRKFFLLLTTCLAVQLAPLTVLRAGPVTNWHTFKSPATTLSAQGTSNPIIGNASLPATSSDLVGYFDALSLTNLGDRITFSFKVSFTDAAGMANAGDNFRFALFDLNGQSPVSADNYNTAGVDGQTDDWRGYWFGVHNGTGTGSAGSIRERISALSSGDNPFAATGANSGSAPSLGTVGGDLVTLQSSTDSQGGPVYSALLAVEKTPSGIALAGFFGGNGATNLMAVNDNAEPFPSNYAAVGYLIGSLNIDQVNFQNVTVEYSPSNKLQIVSQPTNTSTLAGGSATFRVTVSGSGLIPSYQWREEGIDIPNATNSFYTVPLATSGQSGHAFSVVVNNVFGESVISSNAILSVVLDSDSPLVLSASSLVSNVVNVIFSEAVDPVTAQDGSSYSLPGNSISTITQLSPTNVALNVDIPIEASNYVVTVHNVKDLSGNTLTTTNVPGIAHGFQDAKQLAVTNGVAFALNDKILVYSGGSDIFGTQDQCEYAFKTIAGDFDIAVHIESLLNTSSAAKAGLMARANAIEYRDLGFVFDNSRNVMIEATPSAFIMQYRTNELQASFAVPSPRPPTDFPNCWVRLKRTGSVFTGYSSTNFVDWILVGTFDSVVSADPFPPEMLVGLAVTSHNVNQVTCGTFSEFGTFVELPVLTIANVGGNEELTWPPSAVGFNLQAASALSSSTVWTNVPGSSATNRVVFSSGNAATFFRLTK